MGTKQSQPTQTPILSTLKSLVAKENKLQLYTPPIFKTLISAHIFTIDEGIFKNQKCVKVHYLHKDAHYTVIYDKNLNYITETDYLNIYGSSLPRHLYAVNDYMIYQYERSLRLYHIDRTDGLTLMFNRYWSFTIDQHYNLIIADDFDTQDGIRYTISIYKAESRYRSHTSTKYHIPYKYPPHYNVVFSYVLDLTIIKYYLKKPKLCILHVHQHHDMFYVIYIDSDTRSAGRWEQKDTIVDKWWHNINWMRQEILRISDFDEYYLINLLLNRKTVHFNNGNYGFSSVLGEDLDDWRGKILGVLKEDTCLQKLSVSLLTIIRDFMMGSYDL